MEPMGVGRQPQMNACRPPAFQSQLLVEAGAHDVTWKSLGNMCSAITDLIFDSGTIGTIGAGVAGTLVLNVTFRRMEWVQVIQSQSGSGASSPPPESD